MKGPKNFLASDDFAIFIIGMSFGNFMMIDNPWIMIIFIINAWIISLTLSEERSF